MAHHLPLLVLGLSIWASLCGVGHGVPPMCSEVAQLITPCVAYLADRAWGPYGLCCNGIAALNQTATAVEDRIAVCNCLKTIAPRLPMVDLTRAAVLPRACGVNLNVNISPSIDCNRELRPCITMKARNICVEVLKQLGPDFDLIFIV